MARPKPTVLNEIADKEIDRVERVLLSEAIWAVVYQGYIINLKVSGMSKKGVFHKYKKVSFSNRGHAINLCKKLNKQFKTKDDFTVVRLTQGETVYPSREES